MNKKVSLEIITGLSVVAIAATVLASKSSIIGLRANADPVVTLTTLTYDDFAWGKLESNRYFWVTSPNGNKIGIYLGGNCAIGGEEGHGQLTLSSSEEAYVDSNSVVADPSARKYAFSEIKSISVSFTTSSASAYLKIQYFDGEFNVDGYLSNNSNENLNNSHYFKLYPSGGMVNITSIRVTYNSTSDFCN